MLCAAQGRVAQAQPVIRPASRTGSVPHASPRRSRPRTLKYLFLLAAVLLAALAQRAQAVDMYAAVDGSPVSAWRKCAWNIFCYNSSHDANSQGYGVRAGLWLQEAGKDRSALEIGYDKLGSTSGSTDYAFNPACLILCAGATASWRNDASLVYLAWLGRGELGGTPSRSAASAKIGLYHSTITTTGDLGTGAGSYTRRVTGNGLMMGLGYAYPLSTGWAAQAGADVFFNVKLTNPIYPGGTLSELVLRLSLGASYGF